MWKTIFAVVVVLLLAFASWQIVEMREEIEEVSEEVGKGMPIGEENRRILEFINCKVENTKLTIQYGRCLDYLSALRAAREPREPGEPSDPDPGSMGTDPDPGSMSSDPDPGGMITDPDPGGMASDPDPGVLPWFDPKQEALEACYFKTHNFRLDVAACGNRIELCIKQGKCWDEDDGG